MKSGLSTLLLQSEIIHTLFQYKMCCGAGLSFEKVPNVAILENNTTNTVGFEFFILSL